MAGELLNDVFLSVVYVIVGGVLGIILMGISSVLIPRLVDRFTPNIDEDKEIARGNLAVATYFGQVNQAVIIGIAIIVAAAIIAGL